ncbi:hypothetical protein Plhal304r1_c083g0167681 [Plasmopara halstedii]
MTCFSHSCRSSAVLLTASKYRWSASQMHRDSTLSSLRGKLLYKLIDPIRCLFFLVRVMKCGPHSLWYVCYPSAVGSQRYPRWVSHFGAQMGQ